jgi:hypothetical protein
MRPSVGSGRRPPVATFGWSGTMAIRWSGFALLTRRTPNYWDVIAFALIVAVFVAIANGSRGMVAALLAAGSQTVSLDYANLPYYALRTVLRMFAALAASFLFTFTYATLGIASRALLFFAVSVDVTAVLLATFWPRKPQWRLRGDQTLLLRESLDGIRQAQQHG